MLNAAVSNDKIKSVDTIEIKIPAALIKTANPNATDFSREAAQLMALELFREGKISLSRAAELCETPLAAFMEFASAHDVSPIRYGMAELEEDRRTLSDLGL